MTGLGESEFVMVPPVLEEQIWRPELRVSKMRQIKDLGVPALHATKDLQVPPHINPVRTRDSANSHCIDIAWKDESVSKFM